jgi:hypothetical protein
MTRTTLLVIVMLALGTTPARAEWFARGFGGLTFARDSNIIDLDSTNDARKAGFGVAAGRRVRSLDFDAEVALSPRFFRGEPGLLDKGSVNTYTANVAWTLPIRSARFSGYVIAGAGVARIVIADKLGAFTGTSTKFVANAGGGVAARITPRLGMFTELRYFRTGESDPSAISFGTEYLGYARLAVGGRIQF